MFHFAPMYDADDLPGYNNVESFAGASGPFKWDWDEYRPGESYTVVRNENWYGEALLDAIEVRTVPDTDTRALALEAGEVDVAPVTPDAYLRLGAQDQFTQLPAPPTETWVVGPVQTHLGGGHPANDDPRFRLAVHKAIDRQRLHEDVYRSIGQPVWQMWPTHSPAYDPAFDNDPFDPEGAAALLEASGWAGVEIDLFIIDFQFQDAAPEIIQANLQAVGINANLVRQELGVWVDFFLSGSHPGLYMASTGFFWMAPETLPNMNFQFRFPVNAVAAVTGEYKDIVDGFGAQPTPEERLALFNDWNELWAAGPWLIPFHSTDTPTILSSRVQGATWPNNFLTFMDEWWVDDA